MEPRLGADKAICPTLEQEGTENMTQTRARQHLAGMVTVLGAASLASMQTAPKNGSIGVARTHDWKADVDSLATGWAIGRPGRRCNWCARGIGRAAAVALSHAGATVAGIDIAARVSPNLDFKPATVED